MAGNIHNIIAKEGTTKEEYEALGKRLEAEEVTIISRMPFIKGYTVEFPPDRVVIQSDDKFVVEADGKVSTCT